MARDPDGDATGFINIYIKWKILRKFKILLICA